MILQIRDNPFRAQGAASMLVARLMDHAYEWFDKALEALGIPRAEQRDFVPHLEQYRIAATFHINRYATTLDLDPIVQLSVPSSLNHPILNESVAPWQFHMRLAALCQHLSDGEHDAVVGKKYTAAKEKWQAAFTDQGGYDSK